MNLSSKKFSKDGINLLEKGYKFNIGSNRNKDFGVDCEIEYVCETVKVLVFLCLISTCDIKYY